MKNIFFAIFALALSVNSALAQVTYHAPSNCTNYNAFAKNGQIELIEPLIVGTYANGTLYLNPDKSDSLPYVFEMMEIDNGATFEFVRETKSRFDTGKYYRKYQQYYNDVLVEGGGYTMAYIGPGGPTNPCAEPFLLSPHILTEIAVNTTPTISKNSVPSILDLEIEEVHSIELVITHNIVDECEYTLVWKAIYIDDGTKVSFVDAHTGDIINTIDMSMNINAPTVTYGTQNLSDRIVGNTTTLETPDQRIRVYNFNNTCAAQPLLPGQWTNNLIPSTTGNQWTNEAPAATYQTFYVTSLVVPTFENLDINFGTVRVSTCQTDNAFSLFGSTVENAYLEIGNLGGSTAALFDVIGHELGHTFLNDFLDYDNPGNMSLHEGLADVFGTYAESVVAGNVDWVMGDDESNVENFLGRDLENPGSSYDCFTDVEDFQTNQRHDRSKPLSHWYYLISHGNQSAAIPPLGLQHSLNIIIDALNLVDNNADYPDFMNATMTIVEQQFGRCSDEFLAVARAWELICVPTGFATSTGLIPACNFVLTGPNWVCEESEYAQFCAQGGLPNYQFWFRIIGKKSTDYESVCGMTGNTQYGCNCLTLLDFPDYPYYPQYLTIELYSPQAGPQYTQRKVLELVDCDHDDPTCLEYYELGKGPNSEISNTENTGSTKEESEYSKVRVFDFMGRLIFEGSSWDSQVNQNAYQGFAVVFYVNESGEVIKSKKVFLIK